MRTSTYTLYKDAKSQSSLLSRPFRSVTNSRRKEFSKVQFEENHSQMTRRVNRFQFASNPKISDYEGEIQKLLALLDQQKYLLDFVDLYVKAESDKCLSDAAKTFNRKPQHFIAMLADDGVLFKRRGIWIPKQNHVNLGRFTVKDVVRGSRIYRQTIVEAKGMIWIAKRYSTFLSQGECHAK